MRGLERFSVMKQLTWPHFFDTDAFVRMAPNGLSLWSSLATSPLQVDACA